MTTSPINGTPGPELFSSEKIQTEIKNYAEKINRIYQGKSLVIIGVLNGAAFFLTTLVQHLTIDVTLDFLAVSSYTKNHKDPEIKFYKELKISVIGKHVLLLEDIIDTGDTIKMVYDFFQTLKPASIRVGTLVKVKGTKSWSFAIDYVFLVTKNIWVVGFGMDYNEKFRSLPGIYELKCSKSKKPIKNQSQNYS